MKQTYTIKAAALADMPQLISMILQMYEEETDVEPMTPEKAAALTQHLLTNPDHGKMYLIYENAASSAAGYFIVTICYNVEHAGIIANLEDLFILPEYRGRGLGQTCLEYVEKEYAHAVALKLEVSPSNHGAQKLYRKNGYLPMTGSIHMLKTL